MLGTLMKYEFKAVGRLLLPLYGAWLVAAILLGLSLRGDGTAEASAMFTTLTAVIYAVFTISAVVITAIILIQRFYKNLLGNEGYLMFALPVSTGKHLANKIISAAVWITIGILVAVLTAFSIAISIEGFQAIFDEAQFFIGEVQILVGQQPSSLLVILEVLVLVLLGSVELAAEVYAAIAIGHQWSNHRVLGAIAGYIGISIVESIFGSLLMMLLDTGLFDGITSAYYELAPLTQMHVMMLLLLLATAVMTAIYWFISWILLDRRLNLE